MRAARALARLATAGLALAAALLGALAIRRARLPYNSEGRYFDAAESMVYTDGAVPVLAGLAGLAALLALTALAVARRLR